jgi:hypothetical protein
MQKVSEAHTGVIACWSRCIPHLGRRCVAGARGITVGCQRQDRWRSALLAGALHHDWGPHYLEGGTFGMVANTLLGGDQSPGHDGFTDIGLDLQYQDPLRSATLPYAFPASSVAGVLAAVGEQLAMAARSRLLRARVVGAPGRLLGASGPAAPQENVS